MTTITLPAFSLVVLIGPSGSGKSTFAARHFKPTEVLSADFFRGLLADDPTNQDVSGDAFEVLHVVAGKRLAGARLTVVDATHVQPDARKSPLELARRYHCLPVAVVFNIPEAVCQERNRLRQDWQIPGQVVHRQRQQLRRVLPGLRAEGFHQVYVLSTPEEVDAAVVERRPLWCDRRDDPGPFDIIGDVHGCFDELAALLARLGYEVAGGPGYVVRPPAGRKAVFLGDLVDRGPNIPAVLRLVMGMVESGAALCVPGNHDDKLQRKLRGSAVKVAHGLAESLAQLEHEPPEFRDRVQKFLDGLVSHYVLDSGKLVVAHAGMREDLQGRASKRVRDFALYGETTGETDEFGLPVRYNWAAEYRGRAAVVYGHTPVPSRSGSTAPLTSTPVASSAAG
jgi:polynucleotide kinase-phosphatase